MRWGVWSPDDQECWLPVMEQLYDQHWKCSSTSSPSRDDVESENRSIPQILHFIWLGEDFPPEFASLQQRWAEMHPGWEIKLWGDDEIRLLVLENQAAFDDVHNYGGKSDIARYEV
jgi:mannosyltransferase OCH1-like enzyme